MQPKLVIFDLDGTLVNTAEDVTACFNAALTNMGFPGCTLEQVCALLGKPLEAIVQGLLPQDAPEHAVADVSAEYRRVYKTADKPNTRPYPGVVACLEALAAQGIKLAVNSNKPHPAACDAVAQLFPTVDMAVAGYGKVDTTKPDPAGALLLMQEAGATSQETVYVGDTIVDVETAANAGCPCVIVTWGQGTPDLYHDARIAHVVDDAASLAAALGVRQ